MSIDDMPTDGLLTSVSVLPGGRLIERRADAIRPPGRRERSTRPQGWTGSRRPRRRRPTTPQPDLRRLTATAHELAAVAAIELWDAAPVVARRLASQADQLLTVWTDVGRTPQIGNLDALRPLLNAVAPEVEQRLNDPIATYADEVQQLERGLRRLASNT